MTALTIRPMSLDELQTHMSWAALEGWNPGLNDAIAFHAQDPDGFLLGEVNGEPVGMISGVRYGSDFGFMGLYIVRPGFRGNGYGMQLWQAALDHLQGRVLGLDGVLARQGDYARSGQRRFARGTRRAHQSRNPVTRQHEQRGHRRQRQHLQRPDHLLEGNRRAAQRHLHRRGRQHHRLPLI